MCPATRQLDPVSPASPAAFNPMFEPLEPRELLAANAYTQVNLVSDGFIPAAHTDPNLVNPWGLAVHAHGIQVSDADAGFTTGYDGSGLNVGASARVPGPGGSKGAPTGVVANGSPNQFLITVNGRRVPAQFIYVTENGTIDGWSTANGNRAVVIAADRSRDGAVYKGVTMASFHHRPYLYVANFSAGRVDVFNSGFTRSRLRGSFTDPNLPRGFAPFNVQAVGGRLYVAYAKRQAGGSDEVPGRGAGLIDVFSTGGAFLKRFATGGNLNAPWGMAMAPADFGAFSNDLLVGNFGDGRITAFDPATGRSLGQLADSAGQPLAIDGLWGIAFGNGRAGNHKNGLYFAAGSDDEAHGLYGRIIVDPPASPY